MSATFETQFFQAQMICFTNISNFFNSFSAERLLKTDIYKTQKSPTLKCYISKV